MLAPHTLQRTSSFLSAGERFCLICDEEVPAVALCETCDSFMCATHHDRHNRNRVFARHSVVMLNMRSDRLQQSDQCAEHETSPAAAFCKLCNSLICMKCTLNIHSEHDMLSIDELVEKKTDDIQQLRQNYQTEILALNDRLEQVRGSENEVQSNTEAFKLDLENKVRKAIDLTSKYLMEKRDTLLYAVQTRAKETIVGLHKEQQSLFKDINIYNTRLDTLEAAENEHLANYIVQIRKLSSEKVPKLKEYSKPIFSPGVAIPTEEQMRAILPIDDMLNIQFGNERFVYVDTYPILSGGQQRNDVLYDDNVPFIPSKSIDIHCSQNDLDNASGIDIEIYEDTMAAPDNGRSPMKETSSMVTGQIYENKEFSQSDLKENSIQTVLQEECYEEFDQPIEGVTTTSSTDEGNTEMYEDMGNPSTDVVPEEIYEEPLEGNKEPPKEQDMYLHSPSSTIPALPPRVHVTANPCYIRDDEFDDASHTENEQQVIQPCKDDDLPPPPSLLSGHSSSREAADKAGGYLVLAPDVETLYNQYAKPTPLAMVTTDFDIRDFKLFLNSTVSCTTADPEKKVVIKCFDGNEDAVIGSSALTDPWGIATDTFHGSLGVTDDKGMIKIFDHSASLQLTIDGFKRAMPLCWSPGLGTYITCDWDDGKIIFIDPRNGERVITINTNDQTNEKQTALVLASHPNAARIAAIIDNTNHIKLYDVRDTNVSVVAEFEEPDESCWSPTGLAIDQLGCTIVVDALGQRVGRFTNNQQDRWEEVQMVSGMMTKLWNSMDISNDGMMAVDATPHHENQTIGIYKGYFGSYEGNGTSTNGASGQHLKQSTQHPLQAENLYPQPTPSETMAEGVAQPTSRRWSFFSKSRNRKSIAKVPTDTADGNFSPESSLTEHMIQLPMHAKLDKKEKKALEKQRKEEEKRQKKKKNKDKEKEHEKKKE